MAGFANIIKNIGLMALSVALTLLAAEGLLRLLPVNEGLRVQPVSQADPVLRFEPDADRGWSLGWNMAHANRVHVNSAGFVNDQDYDPAGPGPLVAVVGDDFDESLIGRKSSPGFHYYRRGCFR